MKVQVYHDGTVHLFHAHDFSALATLSVCPPLTPAIEQRLKLLHLVRRGRWQDQTWGSEAQFYFQRTKEGG